MSTNILVVDDEESIRNIFTTILEKNHSVVTAADGYEAMEKIQSGNFDLAVLDINVPGPNGIEILRHIKSASEDTEVVIVSGYASLDTAIEAVHQGAYDYIVKPLDIETISDAIGRGIEKRRRAAEAKQLLAQLEQRTLELSALYELRDAAGYALDYREFVEPIMKSLPKIIDHDVSAFLFITGASASDPISQAGDAPAYAGGGPVPPAPGGCRGELTLWVNRGTPADVIDQVRVSVVDAFNSVAADGISQDTISTYVNEAEEFIPGKDSRLKTQGPRQEEKAPGLESPSELRAFLNVALVIKGEREDGLAGMMNISSYKREAFDGNASRLFSSIANNISSALGKLARVLAAEENKLEMMVRNMTDGVIMFDQRGHITVLNPATRKMLGLAAESREQRAGGPNPFFRSMLNPGHLAKHIGNTRLSTVLDRIWRHRDITGKPDNGATCSRENPPSPLYKGEKPVLRSSVSPAFSENEGDGFEEEIFVEKTGKFLSASVSPIKDNGGRTCGIVAVLRDITRRKEIDKAKSAFVSSVSHELRTPLTAIMNAVSIIEMAGEVNDQQQKFLAISMRNVERLERLVNRILDFSKLEDGKLRMDFDFVDLKTLARACVNALQNLAASKSIEIVENIPDGLPKIYADYHRLDQVFTNILDNAIKHTPADGHITIAARLVDSLFVSGKPIPMPHTLQNPGFVEVSISDTGVGISPEDQKRIFDRFEQAGTSYKIGVGLGLSIVKRIIENHYGEIWVESELGMGSKFVFILPVDEKQAYFPSPGGNAPAP